MFGSNWFNEAMDTGLRRRRDRQASEQQPGAGAETEPSVHPSASSRAGAAGPSAAGEGVAGPSATGQGVTGQGVTGPSASGQGLEGQGWGGQSAQGPGVTGGRVPGPGEQGGLPVGPPPGIPPAVEHRTVERTSATARTTTYLASRLCKWSRSRSRCSTGKLFRRKLGQPLLLVVEPGSSTSTNTTAERSGHPRDHAAADAAADAATTTAELDDDCPD